MGLLDGKVVIITGAAGGIGSAEARLCASEGAKLVVNDIEGADELADELGAVASNDSVATAQGAQAIVAKAIDTHGRVDALINNAGIGVDKSLLKMTEAMWDEVLATNLKGTFFCSQAAAKQMIRQGDGGRIVNTTSVAGMIGTFGQANEAAAKAGVYGLTRTSAIELQKHRITVNAVAPLAKTRLTQDLPMFQSLDTLTPEHAAPAALFLASALCGDRTGHVLAVSGSRMYVFKVVEGRGTFKDDSAVWTAQEIADHWDIISKV